MKRKILITGGSGFIGTNLVQYFLDKEFEVLNIDVKEPKKTEHFKHWVNIDITNFELLQKEIISFDPKYFVHLAARTDLDGTTLDDYSANNIGVENIMKIVKQLDKLEKIIITSSMLVCKANYHPKDQHDFAPTTVYGESKVQTEKIVWSNTPVCDWAIIRPTSIWGPWFDVPYKNFFDMVIAKKYFHIGNKSCTKTYGYVENAVYQIEQMLFSETNSDLNKVFYIGDYDPTNIEVWANEISSELGFSVKKIPFSLIKGVAFFGDFLKAFKVNFPMTSFRLKNMTTNNIVDLSNTQVIAPKLPITRQVGIVKTLKWINNNK
ncbi:nucleoside-diphosphate-sugar epimerase [Wenyingzhuangia heitensis]|uniref:Nucleoside-diphosphate-sugar epimerase n=1 Tax=Wenyingzhuangia heitensis TaxID=1487859 RepID=A0ABX0U8Q5_9FLAO|nr:NAD(P)-dependent oxidoreductase [Wenyingzhuangia heitensis]NIJ44315.1 nucleoside-diphosphate-sugar epimerase [Wenyingzhuangia heitensis]